MSVRVGVLGVAGMGMYHVLVTERMPDYDLVAICDVDGKALERAGRANPEAQLVTEPDAVFGLDGLDAVVVATPNAMHTDHVRGALQAGLHVYCEKPLAITVGQCRQLAALAEAEGRKVQVGYQHRFQHHYATAHRTVSSGELGPLYRADLEATHWFRPDSYFDQRPWRGRWETAGGGVLMLQAIHQLDAFAWIAGMPDRVTAQARAVRDNSRVEDEASAMLTFASGARGRIEASTICPTGSSRMSFHGEHGALVCAGDGLKRHATQEPVTTIRATQDDPFQAPAVERSEVEPDGAPTDFDGCVEACHRDFVEAIVKGTRPRNDAVEATKSVELAGAVYMSAVLGAPVSLPLDAEAYDEVFARLCSGSASFEARAHV